MKTTAQAKNAWPARSRQSVSVHFEYVDHESESVCIAGTFNGWHPGATPMIQTGTAQWELDLRLAPGRYEYNLIVDGRWKPDPHCEEKVDNPFGGLNSVLVVRRDRRAQRRLSEAVP